MKLTPKMFRNLPRPLSAEDIVTCEGCGREEKVEWWEAAGIYTLPANWSNDAEGYPLCPDCI